MLNQDIAAWLKSNREQYSWPLNRDRMQSERLISSLSRRSDEALRLRNIQSLRSIFIEIHRWKTGNRVTESYADELDKKQDGYFDIFFMIPDSHSASSAEDVIRQLTISNCNLPASSAIASFLFGRSTVAIIDRYLAMFYKRTLNANDLKATDLEVLSYIGKADFLMHKGGPKDNLLRLAVYGNPKSFEFNLSMFVERFLTDLKRISGDLVFGGYSFLSTSGAEQPWTPVDVEMSIFSWATRNRNVFKIR